MRSLRYLPILALVIAAIMTAMAMTPDERGSFEAFQKRVAAGDPEARFAMSRIYEAGWDTISPDIHKSLILLKASAIAGYAPAMNYLGYLYRRGIVEGGDTVMAADKDSTFYWIARAAEAGDARAMSNLGFLLLNDADSMRIKCDSVEQKAFSLLIRASDMGVPAAMSITGDLYAEGRGVEKDTMKAARQYQKAIEAGLADAEPRLIALMAPKWLALSPDSAYNLALGYIGEAPFAAVTLLEVGARLPESKSENIDETGKKELKSRIAMAAHSMKLLGDASSRGRGLPYGHREAMKWYAKAAMALNPEALEIIAETIEIFPDEMEEITDEIGQYESELTPLLEAAGMSVIGRGDLTDATLLHELANKIKHN